MKKFVSLFLVAVFCIAMLPLQAFAAGDHVHSEECSRTDHVKEDAYAERALVCTCAYGPTLEANTIITYDVGYKSHDNDFHKKWYILEGTCSICHKVGHIETYGPLKSHNWVVYDASCNGTMQTLQYHCRTCGGGHKSDPKPCPAGPHTGGCPVLPI